MDLHKQPLVVIFQVEVRMLTEMPEAVDFVKEISRIDPLIVTVPLLADVPWKETIEEVTNKLKDLGAQENSVVTLTDCAHLGSTSNLLNEESKPKVLPFHSQHEMLTSVCLADSAESMTFKMDNWAKGFLKMGQGIGRVLSQKRRQYEGREAVFTPIPRPERLVLDRIEEDERAWEVDDICCPVDEFVKL
jgi:hypothetical protein